MQPLPVDVQRHAVVAAVSEHYLTILNQLYAVDRLWHSIIDDVDAVLQASAPHPVVKDFLRLGTCPLITHHVSPVSEIAS